MLKFIRNLRRDETGVSALEYGVLAALISVALIAGATTLGTSLGSIFSNVGNKVQSAAATAAK